MSRFMQQQFAPLPTEMEALAREAGDAQSSTPARHPVPPSSHTPHRTFLPGANNSIPSGQSHQTPPAAPSSSTSATRKRPAPHDAPDSEPGSSKTKERRITRTCDQCRNKAATCSGFKPCFMCNILALLIVYRLPGRSNSSLRHQQGPDMYLRQTLRQGDGQDAPSAPPR
jgi:hypothetical protein